MKKTLSSILISLLLLASVACQTYEVKVKVDADGGGSRELSLILVDSSALEQGLSMREFRQLFSVENRDGWSFEKVDGSQDWFDRKFGFFHREREFSKASQWRRQSGDIHIHGSKRRGPHGLVELRNELKVEKQGERLIYREIFRWKGLREMLTKVQSKAFAKDLKDAYPSLSRKELRQLQNLAVETLDTHLAIFLDAGDEDPRVSECKREVGERAGEIIRGHKAGVKLEALSPAIDKLITDTGGRLERLLHRKYPGVGLSFETSVELSVEMPGTITGGNAERIDGNRAIWTFDISDAILAPVEIIVECEH